MDKKTLRASLLHEKKSLSPEILCTINQKIQAQLVSLEQFNKANTVMVYASLPWEVDTSFIWDYVEEKRLVFPKVAGSNLRLIVVKSLEELKPGVMNILEPISEKEIEPGEVDLVIVPGIAFDYSGYRLGYGGGYYDKLLPKVKGLKVGLVPERFWLPQLPREEHDIPVDVVISESRIYRKELR